MRPTRAGLNLLSAVTEQEVVVRNVGDAPAGDVRVAVHLLAAHPGQDQVLTALYAAAIGRPVVPAFALAPGEERVVPSVAALPRASLHELNAGGRAMVVPIVAVNIAYDAGAPGEPPGQLGQAFAVGVERVDSAKLAPLWLDALPRTFDGVAARAVGPVVER